MIIGNTDLKVLTCHGQSDSGWNAQKWKKETVLNEVSLFKKPCVYHFASISVGLVKLG